MKPKEKAIELVNKYLQIYDGRVKQAKQCGLIAVDEIMQIVDGYEDAISISQQSDELEYWQQVKQEIEKL